MLHCGETRKAEKYLQPNQQNSRAMEELLIVFGILLILLILISTLGGSATIEVPAPITQAATQSSTQPLIEAPASAPLTSEPFVASFADEEFAHEEFADDDAEYEDIGNPNDIKDEDFEKDDANSTDEDVFKADLNQEELDAIDIPNVDGDGYADYDASSSGDAHVEPFDGDAYASTAF